MDRTVPSYRIAAEIERGKWKCFRQELDRSERKVFEVMMSYPRLHNTSGVGACKPVLLQPILMSIIFEHLQAIEKKKSWWSKRIRDQPLTSRYFSEITGTAFSYITNFYNEFILTFGTNEKFCWIRSRATIFKIQNWGCDGLGLLQYRHRKTIDLIRPIVSSFILEVWLLRSSKHQWIIC